MPLGGFVAVKKSSASKTSAAKKAAVAKKPPARQRNAGVTAAKPSASHGPVLTVGDKAPLFSLQTQDGQSLALKDFIGKQNVVLYFYPRAMTPGCTAQACGLRDSARALRQYKTVALGVSPDKVSALAKFRERDGLNFDLLSDVDKSTAKQYGAWGLKKFMGREFMGVLRRTFIIGKDGRIKHIMEKVNTQTHHDDVLAFLSTL